MSGCSSGGEHHAVDVEAAGSIPATRFFGMTFNSVNVCAKFYLGYLEAAGSRGYVVGVAWQADVARKVGIGRVRLYEVLSDAEKWWGHPFFDVAGGHRADRRIITLNEHGHIVLDDFLRIAGGWQPGQPYYGLVDNIRDRIVAFRGWDEIKRVTSGQSALFMSDFVLVWQVGRGTPIGELSKLADTISKINSAIGRVEGYFGVRLIKRPTSAAKPNWTEIGLACQPEFREIAERWQRLLMLRKT